MILYLTNADTEVLSIALVHDELDPDLGEVRAASLEGFGDGVDGLDRDDLIAIRVLGGAKALGDEIREALVRARARGVAVAAFSGQADFDPELAGISSVSEAILAAGQAYLISGGPDNFANFFYFLSDTVLLTGIGFAAPQAIADYGILEPYADRGGSNNVLLYFYRAHMVSGNTVFIREIADGLIAAGLNPIPIYCYSLRSPAGSDPREFGPIAMGADRRPAAVVATTLAAGSLDADERSWDASATAVLGVPVFQAIVSSRSRSEFEDSDVGLTPLDASWQVAMPEFDGRIITVPVSFKEEVDSGLEVASAIFAYRCDPERVERMAKLVAAHVELAKLSNADKKIAVVLSAYPPSAPALEMPWASILPNP